MQIDELEIKTPMPTGRLTSNKFKDWINSEFKRLGITDYVVTKVERTRFRQQDYEAFAAFLHITFDLSNINLRRWDTTGYFLCFYSLKEYEHSLRNGHELYIKFGRQSYSLCDLEIDLKKIK